MIAALVIALVIDAMRNNESVCIGCLFRQIAVSHSLQIAKPPVSRHCRNRTRDVTIVDFRCR